MLVITAIELGMVVIATIIAAAFLGLVLNCWLESRRDHKRYEETLKALRIVSRSTGDAQISR